MEESPKTGTHENSGRVRVPWLPTYGKLRRVLRVWPGRVPKQITGLHSTLARIRGTPVEPKDWRDPDKWIPKRLSGEALELAHAIWTGTGKTVNPRHTTGHWTLCQKYKLLAEIPDGTLELTDRGRDFIDHEFGDAEAFLDEQEGLIKLLHIVADRGPARFGDFVRPWTEFLTRHSQFNSDSTITDTLRRRLTNLLDRDLVNRERGNYGVTQARLEYLSRTDLGTGNTRVPGFIKGCSDDEDGRTFLAALADSIEFANSLNRECWATTIPESVGDLCFYVGMSLMMVLESSSKRVEVTLLPKLLGEEHRNRIRSAQVGREYKFPEGARRYRLHLKDFSEQWPLMKRAHHEAIEQGEQKTIRLGAHRVDVISFLNRTLSRKLSQPGHFHTGGIGPTPPSDGFRQLTQSLRDDGLLFSRELVANYIIALQTKRFAILTGISGTGKTRIAKAVAEHFQPTVTRRVPTKIPADAVELEVRLSHLKHSLLTVPQLIVTRLSLLGPDRPVADRQIRMRYPGGETALTHYHRGSTELYLSGEFKQWYHSNLELGDRIWLRVREGEAPESDELEIGLPETEIKEQRLKNHIVVPVRPDWVDKRGLLGYLNPLTGEYSTEPFLSLLLRAHDEEQRAKNAGEKPHPFFVILDEMNLARVEHYFSDFLSALESGEDIPLHENEAIESGESESGPRVPRELKVPGNVLFTGTVNVDETTYMFSPKVLDRAFTIEFDQVDLKGFSGDKSREDTSGLNLDGVQGSLDLLPSGRPDDDWKPSREDWVEFSKETAGHHRALLRLHGILERQHRHFGYRVANEIARFVNLAREQAKDADAAVDAAFDLALLQKVLPKFHGTQQELESLLKEIFQFAGHGPKKNQSVELDDWKVVKGRLVIRSKPQAPSQTPSADAGAEGTEADSDDPETADTGTESPAYPRTGAKVLRMLNRLQDRGFTSFIE